MLSYEDKIQKIIVIKSPKPLLDNALIVPYKGDFFQNNSENNFFVMSLGRNFKLLLP